MMPPRSPWPFRLLMGLALAFLLVAVVTDALGWPRWWIWTLAGIGSCLGAAIANAWEGYDLPTWLEGWELCWPIRRAWGPALMVPKLTPEEREEFLRAWRENTSRREGAVIYAEPDCEPRRRRR